MAHAISPVPSPDDVVRADHVVVRLLPDPRPQPLGLRFGLHFQLEKDWHIYWQNPGDSGAAPKINVGGGSLERIFWPSPKRIPFGDVTNFGYEGDVVLPFLVQVDPSSEELVFDLEWLVCKVECIPGFGQFKFKTRKSNAEPALQTSSSTAQTLIDSALSRVPILAGPWKISEPEFEGNTLSFEAKREDGLRLTDVSKLEVFPHDGRFFKTTAPQIDAHEDKVLIRLQANFQGPSELQLSEITMVTHVGDSSEAQEIKLSLQTERLNFLTILVFAFLGGILLNLMPCVFPVLFLKIYGFIKAFERSESISVRRSAWWYSTGVIFTFLLLGGLLFFLRSAGVAVGWGFQLQQPQFVYVLYLLFLTMALSFLGLLHFGDKIANTTGRFAGSKIWGSDFGSGILSVLVASPCTAPFMGAALGSAMFLPAWGTITVFVALGLGLAGPVFLIAHAPSLARALPKPGPWMLIVQRAMVFPMLGTSVWLLWILGRQTNVDFVVMCLAVSLIVTFLIWLQDLSSLHPWLSRAVIATAFAVALIPLISIPERDAPSQPVAWTPYSDSLIQEQVGHRPVFIDFTAAWCITCQVNKRTVLNKESVLELFRSRNVLLVQADWTDHSPLITKALERYGRNSVPLYVYIDANGNSKILPEILTESLISDVLNNTKEIQ